MGLAWPFFGMQRTAKGLAGQSGFVRRPAKGTAASTSSPPQAVGFVGRYLRPLGLPSLRVTRVWRAVSLEISVFQWRHLSKPSFKWRRSVNEAVLTRTTTDTNQSAPGAGAPTGDFWKRSGQHEPRRVPGHGAPLIGVVFHWAHTFQRSRPHQSDTRHEPKRTGSECPHRRSGSEADSMSRGGYPVTGRPSSKSPSNRRRSFNEVVFHQTHAISEAARQSAVFSFSVDTETVAASRRSCPSTSRFVRATDSTKSCHGTSVMPTSPRWPFSPSSQRPVTG